MHELTSKQMKWMNEQINQQWTDLLMNEQT